VEVKRRLSSEAMSNSDGSVERVLEREVEAFARGMQTWYQRGRDGADLEQMLLSRLSSDFSIVSARGEVNSAASLKVSFSASGGKIPSLSIRVERVALLAHADALAVLSFDEYQTRDSTLGARTTTGRVATAVLVRTPTAWRWLHLHYTWLPELRVKDFVARCEREAADDLRRDDDVRLEHSATHALLTSSSDALRDAAPLVALAKTAQAELALATAKPTPPTPTKPTAAAAAAVDEPPPYDAAPGAPAEKEKAAPPKLPTKDAAAVAAATKAVPQLPPKEAVVAATKSVPEPPPKDEPVNATPAKVDEAVKPTPALPPKDVPIEEVKSTPALPPKDVPIEEVKSTPTLPPKDVPIEEVKSTPALPPKDVPAVVAKSSPALPPKEAAKVRPELPRKVSEIDAALPTTFLTLEERDSMPEWRQKQVDADRRLQARADMEQAIKDAKIEELRKTSKPTPQLPPKNVDVDADVAAKKKKAEEERLAAEAAMAAAAAAQAEALAAIAEADALFKAEAELDEAVAAAKKKEEDAAAAKKVEAEIEATTKKSQEIVNTKKVDEEAAAAEKKEAEAAAAAAAAAKTREEAAAAAQKKKNEEDAAAAQKKKNEEAAAAAQKKKNEEDAAAAAAAAAAASAAAAAAATAAAAAPAAAASAAAVAKTTVPTGKIANDAPPVLGSGPDAAERQRELEARREAADFKPSWKVKEEEDDKRRAEKLKQRKLEEEMRAKGIAVPVPEAPKKETRQYLDDYYNTEKAIAARNLVRFTHFRHVRCDQARRALCYFGPRLNNTAAQNSTIDASQRFYAICLAGGSGSESGALGVLPLDRPGKQAHDLPYVEISSAILDFAFDPFDDARIAVSAENGNVAVFDVPSGGLTSVLREPSKLLKGHTMKATRVWWHPFVADVLLSASPDCRLLVWNARTGAELRAFAALHAEAIVSLTFDHEGARVATVGKDGSVRISDLRSGAVVASLASAHKSKLDVGAAWLGAGDWLFTVGFGATIGREWAVWQLVGGELVEKARGDFATGSGAVQPMYDEDTKLIMCAGKGDSSVGFFEFAPDEGAPYVHLVALHRTADPQRGVAWLPKRAVDVRQVEIRRFLKLTTDGIAPISVIVPRNRPEFFQDDIFPPTRAPQASATCEQWWSGAAKLTPKLVSLKPADMTPLSDAPKVERAPSKYKLKSSDDEAEEDVTEALFVKMNRLAGAKSKEDVAMQNREGVSEAEWDDDGFDAKNFNPGFS
jgi:hypothetical protein